MDILNVPASARPSSGQVISDLAASKDEDQPKATSISTIVVQSSGTRIVIALVMVSNDTPKSILLFVLIDRNYHH